MLNAKREATNSIRRELAKDHPSIAKVNAEYSLWKSTDEILPGNDIEDGRTRGTAQAYRRGWLWGGGDWLLERWSLGPQEALLGELW